jgi:hypothetical protein
VTAKGLTVFRILCATYSADSYNLPHTIALLLSVANSCGPESTPNCGPTQRWTNHTKWSTATPVGTTGTPECDRAGVHVYRAEHRAFWRPSLFWSAPVPDLAFTCT